MIRAVVTIVFVINASSMSWTSAQAATMEQGVPARDRPLAADTATGSLRGLIVAADTQLPLRRAVVEVTSADGSTKRATVSDSDGAYDVNGLPSGRYAVLASKPGYVSLSYGQRQPRQMSKVVTLGARQVVEHLDIAMPLASAFAGSIVDEFGEPVAHVSVQALQVRTINGRRQVVAVGSSALTADVGEFRIWGLMPGDYYLSASLRDPVADSSGNDTRAGYAPTYYPGTESIGSAERLAIGSGDNRVSLSFALRPTRTVGVSGAVVVAANSGAAISVVLRERVEFGSGVSIPHLGRVNADGTFVVPHVTPGEYFLEARSGSGDQLRYGLVPVSVGTTDVDGIVVVPSKGSSFRGRIVLEQGAPQTFKSSDVKLVTIAADPAATTGRVGIRLDDDGTFEVSGLFGPVLVRLSTMGVLREWMLKSVIVNGRDTTDNPIAFDGTTIVEGALITLAKISTEVDGTIKGRPDNEAAPFVVLFASDPERWGLATRFVRVARADQRGKFQIRGVPPGHYAVAALDTIEAGTEGDPEFLERLRAYADAVVVREGEKTIVVLTPVHPQ